MTSTIGYTIHSDEQSMSFNVVAYFKPETAVITLLKDEPAVRIRAPRPGKGYMRTDGKIVLPKNIDLQAPMQVSTKDSLILTFRKKAATATYNISA